MTARQVVGWGLFILLMSFAFGVGRGLGIDFFHWVVG